VTTFTVSTTLYNVNSGSDRDGDHIACEKALRGRATPGALTPAPLRRTPTPPSSRPKNGQNGTTPWVTSRRDAGSAHARRPPVEGYAGRRP